MISPLRLSLVGVVVCLMSNPALAQVRQGQPVSLFDGMTTSGWVKANGQQHDGWVVEDGALHRKSGGGDLYHSGTFRDFILYFQWKISTGGNSGLKYRVTSYGNQRLGCEYQILDDINARERNKAACLYDVYEASELKPVATPDQWHQGKIVVCENRIQHWMDGVLVVQADTLSDEWTERVAKSKFRGHEGFGENREGRIFLQDHGNPVWFRHIVLVPLNCDFQPVSTGCDSNDEILSSWQTDCRPILRRRSGGPRFGWQARHTRHFAAPIDCRRRRFFIGSR